MISPTHTKKPIFYGLREQKAKKQKNYDKDNK
jgi:hypothetical protein